MNIPRFSKYFRPAIHTFHVKRNRKTLSRIVPAGIVAIAVGGIGIHLLVGTHADTGDQAPAAGTAVCGASTLTSPYTYNGSLATDTYTYSSGSYSPSTLPSGLPTFGSSGSDFPSDTTLVLVPSGDNSSVNFGQSNTVYWFATGTHTIGTGQYSSIGVAAYDSYVGAPNTIISGQGVNQFSFIGNNASDTNVTIEYLTVQDFSPPGSQGAVNQNADENWTIEYDTIQDNVPGAAMMVGSNSNIEYDCLTENGQYAFNAYENPSDAAVSPLTQGPENITISNNEISYNNTCNWEAVSNFPISLPPGCGTVNTTTGTGTIGQSDGCGCSGGGKFWQVNQATYDNNYVHNNYSVGMWADTDNNGFDIEGNYFSDNYAEAIIYEISYNALIKDNTFVGNAIQSGPGNPGFPDSAIYISESGGDTRVPGFSSGSLGITDNVFTDNYGGVVLWENANRYCSSSANSSTGSCTLVEPDNPDLYTDCSTADILDTTPYINDCRWRTQNASVNNNVFNFDPTDVDDDYNSNAANHSTGSVCTVANTCGYNALFSEYGTYAPYTGWVVPDNISNHQDNIFSDNTYNGPWNFMGFDQGDTVGWGDSSSGDSNPQDAESSQGWHTGFQDWNGSGDSFPAQDEGSTFNGTITTTTPPSTPNNVTATANSSTSVTVDWSASTDSGGPGLGGYYILRNGTQVGTAGASATSYTDTTANADTAYSYTVEAYDTATPANVSAASAAATVTTPMANGSPAVSTSSITSDEAVHGASLAIDVTATPRTGTTISQVELIVNSTVVQTLTGAPYDFTLNTLNYLDGTNTVELIATSNLGVTGSQTDDIIVTNGDLTSANTVGIAALAVLADHWGQTDPNYADGNITGQTTIGISDLSILAKNWGRAW